MSAQTPYDLIVAKLKADLEPLYTFVEWEKLVDGLNSIEGPFLAVEDVFSEDQLASIGTPTMNCFREEGDIDVHIFVPATEGFGLARSIAEQVRSSIRMKVLSPNVETLLANPPNPGLIADGLWSSMIVGITFRHHYRAPTLV